MNFLQVTLKFTDDFTIKTINFTVNFIFAGKFTFTSDYGNLLI